MRQPSTQILMLRSPSDDRDIPGFGVIGLGLGGLVPSGFFRIDSFEGYTDGQNLNALNGGDAPAEAYGFSDGYVDRSNSVGLQTLDDLESYTDGAAVNGLNGGSGWNGAYVDRQNVFGIVALDEWESYTDGAAVNGLNGGTGWNGAYVDR